MTSPAELADGGANGRPLASLSLDLDNQWSYMKIHGDAGWESYPSYLDVLVPLVLDFLRERNLTISVFVVGQDAALDRNHEALAALAAAGHEIGNHSFRHESWLHKYREPEVEREIAEAEAAIEAATGVRPIGFRGPGFSVSASVLRVLSRRGYLYDASTLPTYIGPLARAYYFMTANLSEAEKQERGDLFGTWSEGRRPVGPYRWRLDGKTLLEIPVTTLPFVKTPIHVSYLIYLASWSPALARAYFATALAFCRWAGVAPSLLLHPLDFLGRDDTEALAFFPGMQLEGARKRVWVAGFLDQLERHWHVRSVRQHAELLASDSGLALLEPEI